MAEWVIELRLKGEDWTILVFYFSVNQIQAVLCLSQLLPCPENSIFLPSPYPCVALSLTKRDVLTFGKNPSPILPSIFPLLAEMMKGESGSSSLQSAAGGAALIQYQSHTSIVFFPAMFVGVQLLVYFSCRKAGKSIWKNTAHLSSVITWPLCQALACWQFQDREWVRPSCSQQEIGKKILICHGLYLPSLLFPSISHSPLGVTAITSHNQLSPFFRCSFLSSFFHPLNGTSKEIT